MKGVARRCGEGRGEAVVHDGRVLRASVRRLQVTILGVSLVFRHFRDITHTNIIFASSIGDMISGKQGLAYPTARLLTMTAVFPEMSASSGMVISPKFQMAPPW